MTELSADGSAALYITFLTGNKTIEPWGEQISGGTAISVDRAGNIYLAGYTNNSDFPTRNAFQATYGGGLADAFVAKLDSNGALVYSTYLGGKEGDWGKGIAVDKAGYAYVTGDTDFIDEAIPTFPLQNPFQSTATMHSAFVTKLDVSGSALVYSTYLNGSDWSFGRSIVVDQAGSAYVAGRTTSGNFPTLNAFQRAYAGSSDAFVTKFLPSGSGLVYSTFLGGSDFDEANGIALDSMGNAFVTGNTYSVGFPCKHPLQPGMAGQQDAFVTKLNASGSARVYSTCLGGEWNEYVAGIVVDSMGRAVIVGDTSSQNYPTKDPFQEFGGGSTYDAFITQLSSSGSALRFSTYWGGSGPPLGDDSGNGVAVDRRGNIYVVGTTSASDFPVKNPVQGSLQGRADAFVVKIEGDILPVVFVHGAAGSKLVAGDLTEYWPAVGSMSHDQMTLYPDPPHPDLYVPDTIRQAEAGGIHVPSADSATYGPILQYLKQIGYREYDDLDHPDYRTTAGCLWSPDKDPSLFVFAYDWRLDNAQNAQLLADFIGCVRKFYPNTKVNLIAHSMGGLLSRRYILDHPDDVNALITVGSPFLGAPKMVNVTETGDFVWFAANSTIKNMIGSFNGISQLLPSQGWYDISGVPPFVEEGQDHDGDGVKTEIYSYTQLITHMDVKHGRYTFYPGAMNRTFHAVAGQDDWRSGGTPVKYYHIYGVGAEADTIGQVVATTETHCNQGWSCETKDVVRPRFTLGDQTVPVFSSARQGPGGDFNAPDAVLMECLAMDANNPNVEHTGLLSNPVVQNAIFEFLIEADGNPRKPLPSATDCGQAIVRDTGAGMMSSRARASPPLAHSSGVKTSSPAPAFYVTLEGADATVVSDALGNSSAIQPDGWIGSVPGAAVHNLGDHAWQVVLANSGIYSITFQTIGELLFLEVTQGAQVTATQAIRYRDIELPAGLTATLTIDAEAVGPLRYDADDDGVFESVVTPTVALTGAAANDLTPPVATITGAVETDTIAVTVAAVDGGTGVSRTLYSLDAAHFQAYTGTLHLDPDQVRTVYAFADDNAANRSALAVYYLPSFTDPDLAIALGRVGTFTAGGTGVYTMTVSNAGLVTANGPVTVTDTLPPGLGFVSATGSGWSCANVSAAVTCTVTASLGVGDSLPDLMLTVSVSDDAWPVVEDRAVVSVTQDAVSYNDVALDWTPIRPRADLTLSIAHDDFFAVGATESYALTVSNLGPLPTDAPISVTDTLPAGLTYSRAEGVGWTCNAAGQTVTCANSGLVTEDSSLPRLLLWVDVAPTATPGVTNTATVASGTVDPDAGNNSASAPTSVRYEADLRVDKTHCHMEGENEVCDPFLAGSTATYQLRVTNFGPSPFDGTVTVSDTLPSGLAFASFEGTDWSCAAVGQLVTCAYSGLVPKDVSLPELSLHVDVSGDVPIAFMNTATITSTVYDPDVSLTNQDNDVTQGTHIPVASAVDITLDWGNIVLQWQCDWADIWSEVWRGDMPYFVPGDAHSARLDSLACAGNGNLMTFIDSTTAGSNYTYVIRAVNRVNAIADSNRAGKFEYNLTPGQ